MPPRLSIVMPSYNQAAFLDEAIASVTSQRAAVDEFIVLDGGSADGSADIIHAHARDIDHWQSAPDAGQAAAIADGFARCTGDIIAFLNSDDVYLPGALKAAVDAFDADAELGFLEGFTAVADEHSRIIKCVQRQGPSARLMRFGYLRVKQPSSFFRRDLYEQIGGIDRTLRCTLDTELWYRLLPACKCARLHRYTAIHRVHDDAKGSAWGEVYAAERAMLDRTYPALRARPLRRALGRVGVNCAKLINGRDRAARRDTRRLRGRTIAEAFPDSRSTLCAE